MWISDVFSRTAAVSLLRQRLERCRLSRQLAVDLRYGFLPHGPRISVICFHHFRHRKSPRNMASLDPDVNNIIR